MSNRLLAWPAWLTARRIGWLDRLSLLLGTLAVAARFLELHALLAPGSAPSLGLLRATPALAPPPGFGWWSWLDQHFYLEAALAWAQSDVTPALHWYPPGYALLGAAFSHLTPADPFMAPDLLCLLGTLWLFAATSARLTDLRLGRSLGVWIFVAATAVPKRVMTAWVVPWSTTPAAFCLAACVLATLRLIRQPNRADAFVAGFAAAAALAFRPADAAVVGGVCAAVAGGMLLARRPGGSGWIVVAATAGALLPLLALGAAMLAVDGLRPDGYLAASAAYGFEWRLLPLHWVILMVDPQPLFVDGQGLAQVFPWIVTGLAGMAACLALRPLGVLRLAHVVVVLALMADVVQFLCFRDLHPDYLWQNGVYHYFKWTLPFFGLYTALLLRALLRGHWIIPVLAVSAVLPGLFGWRVALSGAEVLPAPLDQETVSLPHGLPRVDDVLLVRTLPGQTKLIPAGTEIRGPDQGFHSGYDFKLTPWPATIMVQPLRPMPSAPSTLVFGAGTYTLDPATAAVQARAVLVWGWPCWLWPERRACQSAFLLPARALPLGLSVRFGEGQEGEAYRLAGLAASEPDGDWTDRPRAALSFRLPPGVPGPFALELTAAGFVPTGEPSRVTLYANGVLAGRMAFGRDVTTQHAVIPADAIRPDGNVQLDIAVANPRTPTGFSVTSDTRALGIRIASLRVVAAE